MRLIKLFLLGVMLLMLCTSCVRVKEVEVIKEVEVHSNCVVSFEFNEFSTAEDYYNTQSYCLNYYSEDSCEGIFNEGFCTWLVWYVGVGLSLASAVVLNVTVTSAGVVHWVQGQSMLVGGVTIVTRNRVWW